MRLTIIDGERSTTVDARIDGEDVRLCAEGVARALGWEVREEGLCQGGVCLPTAGHPGLVTADGIDLERLAALLDRPLALDRDEGAAALGEPVAAQQAQLASLAAPDFTLPDLGGRLHRLSEHRGRKVFLLAWASW